MSGVTVAAVRMLVCEARRTSGRLATDDALEGTARHETKVVVVALPPSHA